jgi:hypothetical protein
MNTTGTIVVVGAVGLAVFLLMRSQQQQQLALAAGMPPPGGGAAAGGGIGGMANRLFTQWKSDPLGIEQHKDTLKTAYNVGSTAVSGVKNVASDVVGFIGGLF